MKQLRLADEAGGPPLQILRHADNLHLSRLLAGFLVSLRHGQVGKGTLSRWDYSNAAKPVNRWP